MLLPVFNSWFKYFGDLLQCRPGVWYLPLAGWVNKYLNPGIAGVRNGRHGCAASKASGGALRVIAGAQVDDRQLPLMLRSGASVRQAGRGGA